MTTDTVVEIRLLIDVALIGFGVGFLAGCGLMYWFFKKEQSSDS